MEFICIIIVTIIISIILAIVLKINVKKVKQIAQNTMLDELAKKYPENTEICREILKKLNNEKVIVEENKDIDNCLYIAVTNKIIIAETKNSFTRIQTIAHECLHSVQERQIQLFNFIYSNIYLLYFIIIFILGLIKKLPNEMLFLNIFLILGMVYYFVRAYLENDAMLKARYLAQEYMEEKNILSKEEINKIMHGLDQINSIGIKGVNYSLLLGVLIKAIILALVFLIF